MSNVIPFPGNSQPIDNGGEVTGRNIGSEADRLLSGTETITHESGHDHYFTSYASFAKEDGSVVLVRRLSYNDPDSHSVDEEEIEEDNDESRFDTYSIYTFDSSISNTPVSSYSLDIEGDNRTVTLEGDLQQEFADNEQGATNAVFDQLAFLGEGQKITDPSTITGVQEFVDKLEVDSTLSDKSIWHECVANNPELIEAIISARTSVEEVMTQIEASLKESSKVIFKVGEETWYFRFVPDIDAIGQPEKPMTVSLSKQTITKSEVPVLHAKPKSDSRIGIKKELKIIIGNDGFVTVENDEYAVTPDGKKAETLEQKNLREDAIRQGGSALVSFFLSEPVVVDTRHSKPGNIDDVNRFISDLEELKKLIEPENSDAEVLPFKRVE